MKPYTYTQTVDLDLITDDDVDCIREMAGYGIASYGERAHAEEWPEDAIFGVYVPDEEKDFFLTADQIRKATADLAFDRSISVADYIRQYAINAFLLYPGEFDAGEIDASAGDCIAQIAMFGEIVYG